MVNLPSHMSGDGSRSGSGSATVRIIVDQDCVSASGFGSDALQWDSNLDDGQTAPTGFAKVWSSNDLDLTASGLFETLHVDDLLDEASSSPSSSTGGQASGEMYLPGWNHGNEFGGFVTDSDADSPDGVWFALTHMPSKSLRRSAKASSGSLLDVGEVDGSPGASTSLAIQSASSPHQSPPAHLLNSLAPPRSLRPCISAPELQRDDPVLAASGTQQSINDYLLDVGFPADRIPSDAHNRVSSPLDLGFAADADGLSRNSSSQGVPMINVLSASSSTNDNGPNTSALFQRRATQREGNMPSPAPVSVSTPQAKDANEARTPGRSVTLAQNETSVSYESMTEEQKVRLAQLHQVHVAQQAARLGVYNDFVTPSQQFAGQEASERAAKAVQAALLYGMEGNGPRRLSVGSTGLPTPITPQHPLNPGPSAAGYAMHPLQAQPYAGGAALGGRVPGMPMSAIEPNFSHPAHQQQQQQYMFTPQYYQQGNVFLGHRSQQQPHQQPQQEMQGYTSTYPPPRNEDLGGSQNFLLVGRGMVAPAGGSFGMAGNQLRTSVSSGALSAAGTASEISAHPMQLHIPFLNDPASGQQQGQTTAGVQLHHPVAQRAFANAGSSQQPLPFLQLSQIEPRSAPADVQKEQMALQQSNSARMQQQQQQQLKAPVPEVTTRKQQPSSLTGPLSPPRSPHKMKSSPQLRSPLSPTSAAPPLPGQKGSPSIRKIASNRRIKDNVNPSSWSTSSGKSKTDSPLSSKPSRSRMNSQQSTASNKSSGSTPTAGSSFNFSNLSFVNYGMDDAEELCSAVAPSGSYKVPLKGYGSSDSRSDDDEGSLSDEDEEGTEMTTTSPSKKARHTRAISRSGSASPLKSKRSTMSIGSRARSGSAVSDKKAK